MSAQKKRPTSALGAFFGFVGFAALAGLLVTIGVTPALAVSSVTASSSIGIFQSLPQYISIGQLQQRNTLTGLEGGHQKVFATIYSQNRVNLKWDQVSPYLKNAAVAGEDKRFYEHGGVDLTSLARAAVGSIEGGSLGESGGGSTLTMQLVRNIRLAQAQDIKDPKQQAAAVADAKQVTVSRKLQEMKYAIGLEKKYTKDQILLAYLNIAYFGDQAYGVQAAAQHYYDKDAKDLTPAEAASLIAIVQNPTSRDLATPKNYGQNVARRNVILTSMQQQGYLDAKTTNAAIHESPASYVKLTPATQGCAAVNWPGAQQFCDYVTSPAMVESYAFLGKDAKARLANWNTGGYQLQTSLNLDLTASAKSKIDEYAPASGTSFPLGGVVDSVEPSTGRIIVMAQNKNLTTDPSASANGPTTFLNYSVDKKYGASEGFQVGSTYKLFTLLDWLEKGHGLDEYVNATPRPFPTLTRNGKPYNTIDSEFPEGYMPKNDEGNISGYMTVDTATAESVNVAYASMVQDLDLADIRSVAENLGVHPASGGTLNDLASSFLGTNSIAPLTMASAYATIANKGIYCAPIAIDKVITPEGASIAGQPKSCKQVVSPAIAATAISALQRVFEGGGTAAGGLPDSQPEFGKTGTTDNADQIWLIGSTTALTTATWMGSTYGSSHSLRQYYNPNVGTTYALSRTALFRQVQAVNNTVYHGTDFPTPDAALIQGSGVNVPALAGSTAATAQTTLSGLGLTYIDGGTEASAQPAGQVTSTTPAAGSLVPKGSAVTVQTSDGSGAAVMPTVTGQKLTDAEKAIQSAGFDPSKVKASFTKGDDSDRCQVQSSNPAGGTSVAKNAAIALTVGGGHDGKDDGSC
jgi:membrane peptidoglycan carboxypeptidase